MSEKQPSTLAYIQEMFKDKVDEDVIKLVLTECQYNVEKAVMQLLSLSENTSSKSNPVSASSSHKFDGLDPVDIPLADMQQYVTPVTKNNDSTFLPQTEYCDPLSSTSPISIHNNHIPGTTWPIFPHYAASGNHNHSASQRISPKKAKPQRESKLDNECYANEMYVSDDDIDYHIDSIDSIESISKVNQNPEKRGSFKDTNAVKRNVDQSVKNENSEKQLFLNSQARNKGRDQQLILNSKAAKANSPKLKQVNKPNGSRIANVHPFPPQANFVQNQSPYFANQARFFSSFASSSFSNPFTQPRGNVPSSQYYRPPSQASFRPPVSHQLIPPRFITLGNQGPTHSLPGTAAPVGDKTQNHSLPTSNNTSAPKAVTTYGQGPNHPTQTALIGNSSIGPNHLAQATTLKHTNKGPNGSLPIVSTYGSKDHNHHALTTSSMAFDNKDSNYLGSVSTITHGRKRSNNPTPTTTSMTYGTKGPNPLGNATTLTHSTRQPIHSISNTFIHGNKGPNIPTTTNTSMTYGTKVTDSSRQTSTLTHAGRQPIHSIPITSTYGTKGHNYPASITTPVVRGNKVFNHSLPATAITHGSKVPNYPVLNTSTRDKASYGAKESDPVQSTNKARDGGGSNHPRSVTPTHGGSWQHHTIPITAAVPYDKKASNHSASTMDVDKGSNYGHKEQSKSEEGVQADEKKSLTILRGLPGSGKTALARQLSAKGAIILSTDDYFKGGNNKYLFNPLELSAAHEWNQNRAKTLMEAGLSPLIIDNTNTQSWEMRPYVLIALKCGYKVEIKEPETWWKFNIKELERRNIHGVTSNTLERMLERYEKNVTVQGIANSASTPITVPKYDGNENHGNTTKHKKDNKHESMSNGNKMTNESEKLSQANEKSGVRKAERKPNNTETRKSTTAKKAISLSANFSALRGSSKPSYRENAGAKYKDKQERKDFKNNIAEKDLRAAEDGSSVGENIESNMDAALTSKEEQSVHVAVVSSINKAINEQEASEENSVPQVDMSANNKLDTSGKSQYAVKTSFSESKADLCESANKDTSASQKVQPGVALDKNTRLHMAGFKFESDMNSREIVKSPLGDNHLAGKNTSINVSSNLDEEHEKVRNAGGIDDVAGSRNTFPGSENLFSNEGTSLLPESRVLERDVVTDETQFSCTEEETVNHMIITQNDDKQGDNRENSCPNNQQYFTQNEAPPDLRDSAREEGTGVVLLTDLPDPSNENIEAFIDVEGLSSKLTELTTDSSAPCIKNAKNETSRTETVDKDSSVDALFEKMENFPTNFGFKNDTFATNTDLPVAEDNAQEYDKFHISVEAIVNPNGDIEDRDQSDEVDPFNNMIVSDTTVQPHIEDVVVNPIIDTLSEAKLDVLSTDEVGVRERKEQDSGSDLECVDNTNNNPDTVKHDRIMSLPNLSCREDTNTTIDSSTFIQSSKNDLERVDCGNVSTSNSTVQIDSVSVDLHDNDIRDSLIDRTKTNLKDSILSNSEKCSENEMTSSDAHTNDAHDSIQFLKDCFPHTQVDLLQSFLNSCNGDLIKTVDCLLQYNKNDYEVATLENSPNHAINNDTRKTVLDINSPKHSSVSSPECYSRDCFESPNESGKRDVASRYLNTPDDNNWNSYTSPLSESSTPKNLHDISVDSLNLTLDPALAYQLLEMFGAFSGVSAKDPLSEDARAIRIDKDFAKILYTKWRRTVQARNKAKKIDESKKFSPSGLSDGRTRRKYKTPPQHFYLPDPVQTKSNSPKSVASQPEPISLKEIMDEQLAIHVSQSDQEVEKRYLEEQLDLSTKLKRSRLHGLFPGIDPVGLNEIFQANNYDLDTTILQVQSSCGMPVTGKSTAVSEQQSFANHHLPSNRQNDFQSENSEDFQTDVDGNFQSLQDPSYQDYRAEAQTHFELRTESIKKAALAYSKKQGELAKIYADQARHHGEKIKEANRRAAEKIIESRNHDLVHSNTLDLHELHVNEAIQVLDNVLEERRKERRSPNKRVPSYLEVITGRGNRSRDGKPRIKPAVVDYLKRNGYRYEELNSGLYKVFLN